MRLLAVLIALLVLPVQAAESVWAAETDYANFEAYVGAEPSEAVAQAAAELATHWERVTGHPMPIVAGADPDRFSIWVGGGDKIEGLFAPGDLDTLGGDGIFLKTLSERDLLLLGGGAGGTRYAVYEFLERYLGVRWLTPAVTHIPGTPPPSLPRMSYQFRPVFDYRYSTYLSAVPEAKRWQERMRWVEGPGFACHSFYGYIPPEAYFETHPDYFSEVDGERIAPHDFNWHDYKTWPAHRDRLGQLCMTNEAMLSIIAEKVGDRIRADPENRMPHLSQMDWQNYCTCARCAAIDAEEGTHAASTLWGLNWIAEKVGETFPGYGIETLAYQYTRTPPRAMAVRDNVAVKLCTIECDFSRPLDDPDSVLNAPFAADLRGWAEKAERLHIWNYSANFKNFQQPYPNFHVLKANLQFFARNKVKGIFEQGSYDHGGGFAFLRAYVISKLMWNPGADDTAIRDEFLDLYYGAAAPFLREYIALITQRVQRDGVYMRCFDYGDWMDYDTVLEAEAIFEKAFAAVETDELRARVDLAYLPVQYAALKCPPRITITDDHFTLTRPPSLTLEEYLQRLDDLGITHVVDYKDMDAFLAQIGGAAPPRRLESPLVKLKNDALELWVLPGIGGSVVRLHDLRSGTEWLRGHAQWGHINGVWREHRSGDGDSREFLGPWTVAEHTDDAITLATEGLPGVTLHKTLRLEDAQVHATLTLTLTNKGGAAITPKIMTRPEFYTQHDNHVVLEADTASGDAFTRRAVVRDSGQQTFSAGLPEDAAGCTLRFEDTGRSIVLRGSGIGGSGVFCDARPDRAHLNLDLRMDPKALAPGETRIASYRLHFE